MLDNLVFQFILTYFRSFLKDVYARISKVHYNTSQERVAFFSGHDTTILPLITALGNYDGIWPPYASLMRIELLYGMRMELSYVNNITLSPIISLLTSL
jgi:hypothetical protein